MKAPHEVILFDLDGTLSDPLVGIGRSINYALSHFGYPELPLSELAVHVGPPLDQAFSTITGVAVTSALDGFVAKYRERYGEIGYSENVLYPGIAEALHSLTGVGITLGVCTSKRVDFAEKILDLFGLAQYFSFVSGGEIGTHKWQQIRALLGTGAITQSTVMVGDRAVDITAAHRNGLDAAGVLWGHGSREELEAEQPRYLFTTPAELICLAERCTGASN
ncbi:MAG TPA: HAD hydrolase-like protein [Pyrinomonadaceae bacterium]|jgi:phosphoglycolate phosphatase|nr:HAD hydrolase-like protein [Pyrinomonadaceae bacterium]